MKRRKFINGNEKRWKQAIMMYSNNHKRQGQQHEALKS